jgi:hypothetical protein
MEVWNSSRIPRTVVRQASPTVKPMEAHLMLSWRCFYVIFFRPKGRFVMNKYLYYWTWNLVIMLLLYVWFEHPGHTYGSFVPSFSEWGMTHGQSLTCSIKDSTMECPSRRSSFNHLADIVDVVSHRPLVQDHPYMSKIGGSSQQPQGSNEEWWLTISQRLK